MVWPASNKQTTAIQYKQHTSLCLVRNKAWLTDVFVLGVSFLINALGLLASEMWWMEWCKEQCTIFLKFYLPKRLQQNKNGAFYVALIFVAEP